MAEMNTPEGPPTPAKSSETGALPSTGSNSILRRPMDLVRRIGKAFQTKHHDTPIDTSPQMSRRKFLERVGLVAGGVLVLNTGAACEIDIPDETSSIDVSKFPDTCPPEILAASSSTLDIAVHTNDQTTGERMFYSLSGSVIDSNDPDLPSQLVLTAGHGMRDEHTGNIHQGIERAVAVGRDPTSGLEIKRDIVRTFSNFAPIPAPSMDMCLMEPVDAFTNLPSIRIHDDSQPPAVGDEIFVMDYGPDGDNPNLSRYPASPDYQYQTPALYGGFFVGSAFDGSETMSNARGSLKVMTFRNLSDRDPEEQGRPGASGGIVARIREIEGKRVVELIGIMHAITQYQYDASSVEKMFNIKLNNMPPEERAEKHVLAIVKPVTTEFVRGFKERLKAQPTTGIERWG